MPTPAELFEEARAPDPSFSEDRHPPTVLRRELSRRIRRLAAKILAVEPHAIMATESIALPLQDFEAGVPLGVEYSRIHGVEAVRSGSAGVEHSELRIIPFQHRVSPSHFPSGWIAGDRLFLVGREQLWARYSEIRVHYAGVPADLPLDEDDQDIGELLPTSAWDVIVDYLAAHMARRAPKEVQGGVDFLGIALDHEKDFLGEIADRQGAEVVRVREVW